MSKNTMQTIFKMQTFAAWAWSPAKVGWTQKFLHNFCPKIKPLGKEFIALSIFVFDY